MLEKILQTPGLMLILMEDLTFRQVFLDGRDLEPAPNPGFMGYAVGRWDGETLLVESNGYNDTTWLDLFGHAHSESQRLTERFHRRDFGHLDIEETMQDPKIYARPWTIKLQANLAADTDLIEYVCAENEKDKPHLTGTVSDGDDSKKAVKYVGTYECFTCIPENPAVVMTFTITASGSDLFRNGTRLIPLSDTVFSAEGGNSIEFFKNEQGAVTYFTLQAAGGRRRE
jgi:hypothetical protein